MAMGKATWIVLGVLGAVLLVLLGTVASAVGTYNGLVHEEEEVTKQFNIVGVAYDRAFELLPYLVELAERYMQNESDIQTRVAALRTGIPLAQNGTIEEQDSAIADLRNTVLLIAARAEAYPELRSDRLIQQTMDEWVNSVNKATAEKVRYNDKAQTYNAHRRECCFPVLIAGMFGFEEKDYIGSRDAGRTIEDIRI